MPTYVYECSKCAAVFEADQRIIEDPLDTCIPCGSQGTVKRLIQPIAVMFKGSGFYVNDSAKTAAPAEKSAEIKTEETTKTEEVVAKPETPVTPAAASVPAPAESKPSSS